MARISVWPTVLAVVLVAACGDDAGSSSGSGGASSASSATTTATATSSSRSTGAGGDDPGPQPCVLAEAEDLTDQPTLTITSEGVNYEPRCARVAVGTQVTFVSNFQTHPLVGGPIVDGVGVADPTSPIALQRSGTEVTYTLDEAGEFPYFCTSHFSIGMFGTIWVE
jgi:plastocyanin